MSPLRPEGIRITRRVEEKIRTINRKRKRKGQCLIDQHCVGLQGVQELDRRREEVEIKSEWTFYTYLYFTNWTSVGIIVYVCGDCRFWVCKTPQISGLYIYFFSTQCMLSYHFKNQNSSLTGFLNSMSNYAIWKWGHSFRFYFQASWFFKALLNPADTLILLKSIHPSSHTNTNFSIKYF